MPKREPDHEWRMREGRGSPASQRSVRLHNGALILGQIVHGGPTSRAELAKATGLNKGTVSRRVEELIERRLLREADTVNPGLVGRPAVPLEVDDSVWVGVGLEVNVGHLAVCVRDLAGAVRHEAVVQHDNRACSPEEGFAALAELVASDLEPLLAAGRRCIGAILALPGLVEVTTGRLAVAPNLGWHDLDVVPVLRRLLGEPAFTILVENEANLGALAEHWDGAGRGCDDVLYVSADIGVGGAVIVRGELQRGTRGFAGELGHMPVEPGGERCTCGRRGCLETRAGQRALLRLAGRDPDGAVTASDPHGPVDELIAAARAGEQQVLDGLEEAGRWLGQGLAAAASVLNPSVVVLGGLYAGLAPWLVAPVEAELKERLIGWSDAPLPVRGSALGTVGPVRGGAGLALRRLVADPSLAPRRPPVRSTSDIDR